MVVAYLMCETKRVCVHATDSLCVSSCSILHLLLTLHAAWYHSVVNRKIPRNAESFKILRLLLSIWYLLSECSCVFLSYVSCIVIWIPSSHLWLQYNHHLNDNKCRTCICYVIPFSWAIVDVSHSLWLLCPPTHLFHKHLFLALEECLPLMLYCIYLRS